MRAGLATAGVDGRTFGTWRRCCARTSWIVRAGVHVPDVIDRPSAAGQRILPRIWAARDSALFAFSVLLLVAGVAASLAGADGSATRLWIAATVLGLAYST